MNVPNGYSEVVKIYGDPGYTGSGVSPQWEDAHMVLVRDFPLVPKIYCHQLIVDPLRRALATCAALNDDYEIKTFGCFNPRTQRGSLNLSMHTFGIAVDINGDENPLVTPCELWDTRRAGGRTLPDGWIAAFKTAGFIWGGDFKHRYDPMHFQYATGC